MKVWLLDPGLLNRHGHHFHTDRALVREFRRRGAEIEVFGNRDVEPEILEEMAVAPVFRATAYPSRDGARNRDHAADIASHNRLVEEDLRRADVTLGRRDLILVPTARDIHLAGMLRWYRSLTEPRPVVALRLVFTPWFRVRPEERDAAVATSAEQLAAWASLSRVVLSAESEPLASYFTGLIGKPLWPLPLPLAHATQRNGRRPVADRTIRVVFLGEARREKGFHLLADALRRVVNRCPQIELTVQTSCLFDVDQAEVTRLRSLPIEVRTIDQPLSRRDYQSLLKQSDLILAAYDPIAYELRTSSIFLEAVGAGKPVLVSAGTWMAQEARRLGLIDVTATEFTSPALAAALGQLLDRWPEALRRSHAAAAATRRHHSARTFVDGLMSLVEGLR